MVISVKAQYTIIFATSCRSYHN